MGFFNLLFGQNHLTQEEIHNLVVHHRAILLDVRSESEFANGAVSSSINIPLEKLPHMYHTLPKDRPIILYCASGGRSIMAKRFLEAQGFKDVKDAGSWITVSHAVDRAKH